VDGSAPISLRSATYLIAGTWNEGGDMVAELTNLGPLRLISASGGKITFITELKPGEMEHGYPHFLPSGKAVLFTVATTSEDRVDVLSLPR